LVETLSYAVAQSRRPKEIVIVDASDDWQAHRAEVQRRFARNWNEITLIYVPADTRSLTFQRNQAIRLATSDIVFSLDDDIYLFADAAERIMDVYEADTENEVAMVAGHFTQHAPVAGPLAATEGPRGLNARLQGWLEQQLTLDKHFVPYGAKVDCSPLPPAVRAAGASADGLINGGRTTVRRAWAVENGWSEILRYYSTHEDSDFSYRMSRFGRLAHATQAGFFHADGNDRATSRYRINTIRVRNLMALHVIHSDARGRSALRLAQSFAGFALLYAAIDPIQKRFTFPTVRAYIFGLVQIPVFLFWPFKDFRAWYTALQEKMYGTRYKS
jgi:glycosyltransferase involved in cell wall biosynthesis